ncbi:hypothetical protein V8E53_015480 [Lactarius tabidus]
MPPKKTSEPPLSKAESLLLKIAARIFTTVKYKECHPDKNHTNFQRNMMMEMEHVKKIFADYPQEKRVAKDNDCQPVYATITSEEITKCIQGANWLWPMVLKLQDLSKEVMPQPPEMHWWLLELDDEEEGDAIKPACCISKRKMKGKAPIPADSDIGAGCSDVSAGCNTLQNLQLAKDATTPDKGNAINDNKNKKEKDDATLRDTKCIMAKFIDFASCDASLVNTTWGALKPSKACTNCASWRKACIPPKKWLKQVTMICQELRKRDGGNEGEDKDNEDNDDKDKDKDNDEEEDNSQWQNHLNIMFLLRPHASVEDLLKPCSKYTLWVIAFGNLLSPLAWQRELWVVSALWWTLSAWCSAWQGLSSFIKGAWPSSMIIFSSSC